MNALMHGCVARASSLQRARTQLSRGSALGFCFPALPPLFLPASCAVFRGRRRGSRPLRLRGRPWALVARHAASTALQLTPPRLGHSEALVGTSVFLGLPQWCLLFLWSCADATSVVGDARCRALLTAGGCGHARGGPCERTGCLAGPAGFSARGRLHAAPFGSVLPPQSCCRASVVD